MGNSLPPETFLCIVRVPRPDKGSSASSMTDEKKLPADPADESAARDFAWMERVKEGDMEAFQELIEAHQQRVIATVTKMLGDEADGEDVAQQVFVRVWKSAPRYEPTAKFTTWLFKITRNLVFNELRRRKRAPVQSLDTSDRPDHEPIQMPDSKEKTPDTAMLDAEMQEAIQAAIDSLPETQRMAIILRRYDEFSYEEIGEILKLSVPAVKSVIFRARIELKEKLRRYLDA